MLNVMMMVTG